MHVIVGQGQLDAVLQARPEDRRGFIEEAAGVLKHRKRKEKALRKLDAMQANLTRLQDLTGELHRQLKPLGRQAEVARRAAVIQADLRDARLRLLADDLVTLRGALEQEVADETALRQRRGRVERRWPMRRAGRPSWRPQPLPRRRGCPRRRTPGSGCRACGSGCAAPPRSLPSGRATSPATRRRAGRAATPRRWRPMPGRREPSSNDSPCSSSATARH